MTFFVSGQPLTVYGRLSDNTATTIFTATKRTTIVAIACTETNGGVQTLSIFRTAAGGGDYFLRKALAVTAKQRVLVDETFVLNPGDMIKAQSGDAAGYFDTMVTYLAPDAGAVR